MAFAIVYVVDCIKNEYLTFENLCSTNNVDLLLMLWEMCPKSTHLQRKGVNIPV